MSVMIEHFHFLRPWWLLGLGALPLLLVFALRQRSMPSALSQLVDPELLPYLLRGQPASRQLPMVLLAAGLTLASLAFAGPTWNRVAQPLYASRAAQVVAISLSQDMLSRDVAPSRLDRARYKAHDLLASNADGLNALIGYAGEAFVVAPLTSDAGSLSDLLNAMSPDTMPVEGNDAALAIQRGAALIHDANASNGMLVLITDQANAAADAAARVAAAAGVRVSVLGAGTTQGGPIPQANGEFLRDDQGAITLAKRDDASLVRLAAAGGGIYLPMASDRSDIAALKQQLRTSGTVSASGQSGDEWQDRGPWLLLPLLLVVAFGFRRGWLLLVPLIVLPMLPGRAVATDWRSLWQRPDQQAAQTLRQGGPARQAQQLARDPAWRGAADYRMGDFPGAAATLAPLRGTDASYNRGNALAKNAQYLDAIKAYDEALKRDPSNADAAANKKAIEDWLKQQKKSPDKSSKDQSGKGNPPPKPDGSGGKDQQGKGDGKGEPKSGEQGKDDHSAGQSKADEKPSQDPGKSDQKGQPDGQKQPPEDGGAPGNAGQNPAKQDPAKPDERGQGQAKDEKPGDQPAPQTPQQQAEQKARADKAQQALQKQMDQALADKGKPAQGTPTADKATPHQLGAMTNADAQSKLPADLRQALQRVPDDPGALLRRKFQLEYRQRHGGVPGEDDQP